MGEYVKIKKGAIQGYVLSPDLLKPIQWKNFKTFRKHARGCCVVVVVRGNDISLLHYADDTILLAIPVEQLQGLVDKIILENAKKCVNTKNDRVHGGNQRKRHATSGFVTQK